MMKLYRIRYHYWDDYAFATSWCSDCPRRDGGECCKDEDREGFWVGNEDFLELAPNRFVMQSRLNGRRVPNVYFSGIRVEEVPFQMWQCWRRDDLNRKYLEEPPDEPCFSDPIIMGREYVPRKWLFELYEQDKLGA